MVGLGVPIFRVFTVEIENVPNLHSLIQKVSEWVSSGLTSHQQCGHTETRPQFRVSSERPEKRGIDLAIPG